MPVGSLGQVPAGLVQKAKGGDGGDEEDEHDGASNGDRSGGGGSGGSDEDVSAFSRGTRTGGPRFYSSSEWNLPPWKWWHGSSDSSYQGSR